MKTAIVFVQGATFVVLAALFAVEGNWRFAGAQAALAVVTVLVYLP